MIIPPGYRKALIATGGDIGEIKLKDASPSSLRECVTLVVPPEHGDYP